MVRTSIAWIAAIALAGCSFDVDGLSPLADDLGGRVDAGARDMAPGFVPSHVSAAYLGMGTADLDVTSSIDTSALQIDGAAPPSGAVFVADGAYAVLAVHALHVGPMKTIAVTGSRPLIVVADGIAIEGTLDAGAHHAVPGPGGAAPGMGPGAGGAGRGSPYDVGGSGSGYNGVGGGSGNAFCATTTSGNPGGIAYGDDHLTSFVGGSGGGGGTISGGCQTGGILGGAGGGAIQLSAGSTLTVSGVLNAGGGGGGGACTRPPYSGSGAGGGSGGSVLLESPMLVISGVIAANGGGGGGAAYSSPGGDGDDAGPNAVPAAGGKGGNSPGGTELMELRGAPGGTTVAPGTSASTTDCSHSGGGGGAAGRIFLRARGNPTITAATVSPTPVVDSGL